MTSTATRRPWTPDQVFYRTEDNERMLRRAAKRICDKCGLLLGDLTDREMVREQRQNGKYPLNIDQRPVSDECPRCNGLHVLFADPAPHEPGWKRADGDTWTLTVLCPGPPSGMNHLPCATWEPCGCVPPERPRRDDDGQSRVRFDSELTSEFQTFINQACPNSPTGGHAYLYDTEMVGAPTGGCWLQSADPTMIAAGADKIVKAPGLWPVHVEVDDGEPVFTDATRTVADKVPA